MATPKTVMDFFDAAEAAGYTDEEIPALLNELHGKKRPRKGWQLTSTLKSVAIPKREVPEDVDVEPIETPKEPVAATKAADKVVAEPSEVLPSSGLLDVPEFKPPAASRFFFEEEDAEDRPGRAVDGQLIAPAEEVEEEEGPPVTLPGISAPAAPLPLVEEPSTVTGFDYAGVPFEQSVGLGLPKGEFGDLVGKAVRAGLPQAPVVELPVVELPVEEPVAEQPVAEQPVEDPYDVTDVVAGLPKSYAHELGKLGFFDPMVTNLRGSDIVRGVQDEWETKVLGPPEDVPKLADITLTPGPEAARPPVEAPAAPETKKGVTAENVGPISAQTLGIGPAPLASAVQKSISAFMDNRQLVDIREQLKGEHPDVQALLVEKVDRAVVSEIYPQLEADNLSAALIKGEDATLRVPLKDVKGGYLTVHDGVHRRLMTGDLPVKADLEKKTPGQTRFPIYNLNEMGPDVPPVGHLVSLTSDVSEAAVTGSNVYALELADRRQNEAALRGLQAKQEELRKLFGEGADLVSKRSQVKEDEAAATAGPEVVEPEGGLGVIEGLLGIPETDAILGWVQRSLGYESADERDAPEVRQALRLEPVGSAHPLAKGRRIRAPFISRRFEPTLAEFIQETELRQKRWGSSDPMWGAAMQYLQMNPKAGTILNALNILENAATAEAEAGLLEETARAYRLTNTMPVPLSAQARADSALTYAMENPRFIDRDISVSGGLQIFLDYFIFKPAAIVGTLNWAGKTLEAKLTGDEKRLEELWAPFTEPMTEHWKEKDRLHYKALSDEGLMAEWGIGGALSTMDSVKNLIVGYADIVFTKFGLTSTPDVFMQAAGYDEKASVFEKALAKTVARAGFIADEFAPALAAGALHVAFSATGLRDLHDMVVYEGEGEAPEEVNYASLVWKTDPVFAWMMTKHAAEFALRGSGALTRYLKQKPPGRFFNEKLAKDRRSQVAGQEARYSEAAAISESLETAAKGNATVAASFGQWLDRTLATRTREEVKVEVKDRGDGSFSVNAEGKPAEGTRLNVVKFEEARKEKAQEGAEVTPPTEPAGYWQVIDTVTKDVLFDGEKYTTSDAAVLAAKRHARSKASLFSGFWGPMNSFLQGGVRLVGSGLTDARQTGQRIGVGALRRWLQQHFDPTAMRNPEDILFYGEQRRAAGFTRVWSSLMGTHFSEFIDAARARNLDPTAQATLNRLVPNFEKLDEGSKKRVQDVLAFVRNGEQQIAVTRLAEKMHDARRLRKALDDHRKAATDTGDGLLGEILDTDGTAKRWGKKIQRRFIANKVQLSKQEMAALNEMLPMVINKVYAELLIKDALRETYSISEGMPVFGPEGSPMEGRLGYIADIAHDSVRVRTSDGEFVTLSQDQARAFVEAGDAVEIVVGQPVVLERRTAGKGETGEKVEHINGVVEEIDLGHVVVQLLDETGAVKLTAEGDPVVHRVHLQDVAEWADRARTNGLLFPQELLPMLAPGQGVIGPFQHVEGIGRYYDTRGVGGNPTELVPLEGPQLRSAEAKGFNATSPKPADVVGVFNAEGSLVGIYGKLSEDTGYRVAGVKDGKVFEKAEDIPVPEGGQLRQGLSVTEGEWHRAQYAQEFLQKDLVDGVHNPDYVSISTRPTAEHKAILDAALEIDSQNPGAKLLALAQDNPMLFLHYVGYLKQEHAKVVRVKRQMTDVSLLFEGEQLRNAYSWLKVADRIHELKQSSAFETPAELQRIFSEILDNQENVPRSTQGQLAQLTEALDISRLLDEQHREALSLRVEQDLWRPEGVLAAGILEMLQGKAASSKVPKQPIMRFMDSKGGSVLFDLRMPEKQKGKGQTFADALDNGADIVFSSKPDVYFRKAVALVHEADVPTKAGEATRERYVRDVPFIKATGKVGGKETTFVYVPQAPLAVPEGRVVSHKNVPFRVFELVNSSEKGKVAKPAFREVGVAEAPLLDAIPVEGFLDYAGKEITALPAKDAHRFFVNDKRNEKTPEVRPTAEQAAEAKAAADKAAEEAGVQRPKEEPVTEAPVTEAPVTEAAEAFVIRENAEGKFDIVEASTGDSKATLRHPYMANELTKSVNKLAAEGRLSQDSVVRATNRLFSAVKCTNCKADVGQPCKRPSGATTPLEKPHAARSKAFDKWLLEEKAGEKAQVQRPKEEPVTEAPTTKTREALVEEQGHLEKTLKIRKRNLSWLKDDKQSKKESGYQERLENMEAVVASTTKRLEEIKAELAAIEAKPTEAPKVEAPQADVTSAVTKDALIAEKEKLEKEGLDIRDFQQVLKETQKVKDPTYHAEMDRIADQMSQINKRLEEINAELAAIEAKPTEAPKVEPAVAPIEALEKEIAELKSRSLEEVDPPSFKESLAVFLGLGDPGRRSLDSPLWNRELATWNSVLNKEKAKDAGDLRRRYKELYGEEVPEGTGAFLVDPDGNITAHKTMKAAEDRGIALESALRESASAELNTKIKEAEAKLEALKKPTEAPKVEPTAAKVSDAELVKGHHAGDVEATQKMQARAEELLPGVRMQDALTVVATASENAGVLPEAFVNQMIRENRVAGKKPEDAPKAEAPKVEAPKAEEAALAVDAAKEALAAAETAFKEAKEAAQVEGPVSELYPGTFDPSVSAFADLLNRYARYANTKARRSRYESALTYLTTAKKGELSAEVLLREVKESISDLWREEEPLPPLPKGEKKTIAVDNPGKPPREVEAAVYADTWAIHKPAVGKGSVVTHVPTGLSGATFNSAAAAQAFIAKALDAIVAFDAKNNEHLLTFKELREAVKDLEADTYFRDRKAYLAELTAVEKGEKLLQKYTDLAEKNSPATIQPLDATEPTPLTSLPDVLKRGKRFGGEETRNLDTAYVTTYAGENVAVVTDGHRLVALPVTSKVPAGLYELKTGEVRDAVFPPFEPVLDRAVKEAKGTFTFHGPSLEALAQMVAYKSAARDGLVHFGTTEQGNVQLQAAYRRRDKGEGSEHGHQAVGAPLFGAGSNEAFPGLDMVFNAKYIADALSGAEGPVRIVVSDNSSGITILRKDGEAHFVMPQRLDSSSITRGGKEFVTEVGSKKLTELEAAVETARKDLSEAEARRGSATLEEAAVEAPKAVESIPRTEIVSDARYTIWEKVGDTWLVDRSYDGVYLKGDKSLWKDDFRLKDSATGRDQGVFPEGVDPNVRAKAPKVEATVTETVSAPTGTVAAHTVPTGDVKTWREPKQVTAEQVAAADTATPPSEAARLAVALVDGLGVKSKDPTAPLFGIEKRRASLARVDSNRKPSAPRQPSREKFDTFEEFLEARKAVAEEANAFHTERGDAKKVKPPEKVEAEARKAWDKPPTVNRLDFADYASFAEASRKADPKATEASIKAAWDKPSRFSEKDMFLDPFEIWERDNAFFTETARYNLGERMPDLTKAQVEQILALVKTRHYFDKRQLDSLQSIDTSLRGTQIKLSEPRRERHNARQEKAKADAEKTAALIEDLKEGLSPRELELAEELYQGDVTQTVLAHALEAHISGKRWSYISYGKFPDAATGKVSSHPLRDYMGDYHNLVRSFGPEKGRELDAQIQEGVAFAERRLQERFEEAKEQVDTLDYKASMEYEVATRQGRKTVEPKVEEPKVEEAVVAEAPKVEEPKVEETVVAEAPKVEEPKVEEPKVEETVVAEAPKVEETDVAEIGLVGRRPRGKEVSTAALNKELAKDQKEAASRVKQLEEDAAKASEEVAPENIVSEQQKASVVPDEIPPSEISPASRREKQERVEDLLDTEDGKSFEEYQQERLDRGLDPFRRGLGTGGAHSVYVLGGIETPARSAVRYLYATLNDGVLHINRPAGDQSLVTAKGGGPLYGVPTIDRIVAGRTFSGEVANAAIAFFNFAPIENFGKDGIGLDGNVVKAISTWRERGLDLRDFVELQKNIVDGVGVGSLLKILDHVSKEEYKTDPLAADFAARQEKVLKDSHPSQIESLFKDEHGLLKGEIAESADFVTRTQAIVPTAFLGALERHLDQLRADGLLSLKEARPFALAVESYAAALSPYLTTLFLSKENLTKTSARVLEKIEGLSGRKLKPAAARELNARLVSLLVMQGFGDSGKSQNFRIRLLENATEALQNRVMEVDVLQTMLEMFQEDPALMRRVQREAVAQYSEFLGMDAASQLGRERLVQSSRLPGLTFEESLAHYRNPGLWPAAAERILLDITEEKGGKRVLKRVDGLFPWRQPSRGLPPVMWLTGERSQHGPSAFATVFAEVGGKMGIDAKDLRALTAQLPRLQRLHKGPAHLLRVGELEIEAQRPSGGREWGEGAPDRQGALPALVTRLSRSAASQLSNTSKAYEGAFSRYLQDKNTALAKDSLMDIWVSPELNAALKAMADSVLMLNSAGGMRAIVNSLRGSRTALNPSTHVGNIIANHLVLSLDIGELVSFKKLIEEDHLFREYLRGEAMPARERAIYDAIVQTETPGASAPTDLGKAALQTPMQLVAPKLLGGSAPRGLQRGLAGFANSLFSGLGRLNNMILHMYGREDTSAKLFKSRRDIKEMMRFFGLIKEKDTGADRVFKLRLEKREKVEVYKLREGETQGGRYVAAVRRQRKGRGGQEVVKLTEAQMLQLFAKASQWGWHKYLVNYHNLGIGANRIKASPALSTFAANPWYSWLSMAVAIPGITRGIPGELTTGNINLFETKNPRIQMAQARHALKTSLRRGALSSVLMAAGHRNDEDWRQVLEVFGFRRDAQDLAVLSRLNAQEYLATYMTNANLPQESFAFLGALTNLALDQAISDDDVLNAADVYLAPLDTDAAPGVVSYSAAEKALAENKLKLAALHRSGKWGGRGFLDYMRTTGKVMGLSGGLVLDDIYLFSSKSDSPIFRDRGLSASSIITRIAELSLGMAAAKTLNGLGAMVEYYGEGDGIDPPGSPSAVVRGAGRLVPGDLSAVEWLDHATAFAFLYAVGKVPRSVTGKVLEDRDAWFNSTVIGELKTGADARHANLIKNLESRLSKPDISDETRQDLMRQFDARVAAKDRFDRAILLLKEMATREADRLLGRMSLMGDLEAPPRLRESGIFQSILDKLGTGNQPSKE